MDRCITTSKFSVCAVGRKFGRHWGSTGRRFESGQPDRTRFAVDLGKKPDKRQIFGPAVDLDRSSTKDPTRPETGASGPLETNRDAHRVERPNLELLLPLARAHGVPLDELVGGTQHSN
jgi:hypothetical protein